MALKRPGYKKVGAAGGPTTGKNVAARSALGTVVDRVVIIVKENHTFDNYFGTFPGAEGAHLKRAANPPPDDPNHRHEAWEKRASDQVHKVQYIEGDIPPYF